MNFPDRLLTRKQVGCSVSRRHLLEFVLLSSSYSTATTVVKVPDYCPPEHFKTRAAMNEQTIVS